MHQQTGLISLLVGIGVLMLTALTALAADRTNVLIPGDNVYPESITATADGTLINGGMVGIYRTEPGAPAAELWIKPGTGDWSAPFRRHTVIGADGGSA